MNHYTQALAELKAQPAHKLSEVGDQWQTPPALFWGVNAVFGPFVLDLFTDGEWAWPATPEADATLLAAMKAGTAVGLVAASMPRPSWSLLAKTGSLIDGYKPWAECRRCHWRADKRGRTRSHSGGAAQPAPSGV
jgi:hypothetical protein